MFLASGLRKDIHPVKTPLHYLQWVFGPPVNRQIIIVMCQFVRHAMLTVKLNLLAPKTWRPRHAVTCGRAEICSHIQRKSRHAVTCGTAEICSPVQWKSCHDVTCGRAEICLPVQWKSRHDVTCGRAEVCSPVQWTVMYPSFAAYLITVKWEFNRVVPTVPLAHH